MKARFWWQRCVCLGSSIALVAGIAWGSNPAVADEGAGSGSETLEVTYLTNEGFLLSCGETKVLIDALVPAPYKDYLAMPKAVWAMMLSGDPPFDGIDLSLVSHRHEDHFQPQAALEFLTRQSGVVLASSPEVVALLHQSQRSSETSQADGLDREIELREVWPEPGKIISVEWPGVRVDFLNLPHGGAKWADIQNLGHVIQMCGKRILHVGDALEDPKVFEQYRQTLNTIDVSILPAWYFFEKSGPALIETLLGEAELVVAHVERHQIEEIVDHFAETHPTFFVPSVALETRRFP